MLAKVNAMTERNQHSEFIILKRNYTFQLCTYCDGSGKHFRTFRKMNFVEDCPKCSGQGRIRLTTSEEVPLSEALKEISINK